jgi:hypothetical protein
LGVKSSQGEELTFTISDTTLPSTIEVYLDDIVAGTSTLLNSGDYILTPATALNGDGRFFLRLEDSATTYIYNNAWSASGDPSGVSLATDNIIIEAGDAIISSTTNISKVTVNPGASLTVAFNETLTVTTDMTLESISTSYSSLILYGTINGTVNYERHVNGNSNTGDPNAIGNNDLVSPPLSGQTFGDFASANPNLLANPNNNLQKAFAPFNKAIGWYENYSTNTNATTLLDASVGYRVATSNTATLTFTGTVNKDVIENDILNSGPQRAEWNVVGNPHPSYLKVQDFLNYEVAPGVKNISLFQFNTAAIYGFGGSNFTVYNLVNTLPSTVIAPGQGFIVTAEATQVAAYNLTFAPEMRATATSDDFITGRTSTPFTFLKLNASTTQKAYTTEFYFNDNASQGLDIGYDATLIGSTPDFALYSHLVQDNSDQPILLQALNPADLTNVTIPLGVNANQGEQLTFTISDSTLPTSVQVYLDDTVAGTSTLLNTGDYTLTPNAALNGTGRFYLRVSNSTLSTPQNTLDAISIYTNDAAKTIVIAGELLEATTAKVYDLQGRAVSTSQLDATNRSQSIDVSNLSTGVYVIQLQNATGNITQKVIIR